ncbi:hypothetical protein D3C81_2303270 [compost metagenome]
MPLSGRQVRLDHPDPMLLPAHKLRIQVILPQDIVNLLQVEVVHVVGDVHLFFADEFPVVAIKPTQE